MYTSIVIPTYNNYDQLADCVQSIIDHTHEPYEIIIMDNGNEPLGYVDPAARGMAASRGDLICVINDDTTVEAGWLPPLLEAAEQGHWVFSPAYHDERNMKALGWFLCFSRQGYIGTGGFDTKYKVWCADVDLFTRCEQLGKPVLQIPGSNVNHLYSQTTSRVNQDWMRPAQDLDMDYYKEKWGRDPNYDKYA